MRVTKMMAASLLGALVMLAAVTEVVFSQTGSSSTPAGSSQSQSGTESQSSTPAGSSQSTPTPGSSQMGTPGAGAPGASGLSPTPGSSAVREDQESIRQAQQQLQSAGFTPGPINGVMNEETRTALQQFQQSKGLTASGQLDQETWAALRSASGTPTPSERSQ